MAGGSSSPNDFIMRPPSMEFHATPPPACCCGDMDGCGELELLLGVIDRCCSLNLLLFSIGITESSITAAAAESIEVFDDPCSIFIVSEPFLFRIGEIIEALFAVVVDNDSVASM